MNLTIKEIVKAHTPRIIETCVAAHELLMQMDQNKVIPDEQTFFDSIKNDKEVKIPVVVAKEVATIGDVSASVADLIREAEESLEIITIKAFTETEALMKACWTLELSSRGETNPVTIGAQPIALRTLALLQAERKTRDLAEDDFETKLSPNWACALGSISDETEMAQDFLNEVIPNVPETMNGDYDLLEFFTSSKIPGHPTEVVVEFCQGQVIAVVTISISIDKDGNNNEIAIIDDNNLIIDQKIPESLLIANLGKPLESLFDHGIIRDLDLIITGYEVREDDTIIAIEKSPATPLIMKDAPTNWTA